MPSSWVRRFGQFELYRFDSGFRVLQAENDLPGIERAENASHDGDANISAPVAQA
ncbi:hypothetical protein [Rhizobium binae]|uniref:hypothetical protein n=1 Tax=Rhizobium binae TaxID=1138190 RepID=UPI001C83AA77|nr:hypothetical protein [Rhizobium binae]MBX4927428.1 hypothetical protein [Rhizobium binae]MBX4938687.1 hypothetical protein [Rhizobium binae]MBX4945310.1 hypothetical protein [Rhizobium binae]MBX4948559.1 hypothetical protein [Rhizobium binae]MBX4962380.1 hypothetical protein [Rhizobium binae]